MTEQVEKRGARHNKSDMDMLQTMHDHSVKLGATCPGGGMVTKREANVQEGVRIAKLDEQLGLVMGYAIVCKVNDKDYYDLNVDFSTGERVPEHIPEGAMLKAALQFAQTARMGNEMHVNNTVPEWVDKKVAKLRKELSDLESKYYKDAGMYPFVFPLTSEIAKAYGIGTNITGLMVAYKPTPEIFAKFKSGELRGFSIEGRRLAVREHE